MRSAAYTSLCIALLLVPACERDRGGAARASRENLTFTAADATLEATLWRPAREKPPGLLLLPDLRSHRGVWDALAPKLQRTGYLVLAVDLVEKEGDAAQRLRRGKSLSPEDQRRLAGAVVAAKRRLLALGASEVALIGEATGANLALLVAQHDPGIKAVAAVSPGLDLQGLSAEEVIPQLKDCPLLLMASEGDAYAAASTATLDGLATGFCELRSFSGAAHGADLFASGNAGSQLIQWLDTVIPVERR